ncbi:RNA polymerase sigma factor [Rhizosphaericola mali]|uniref:Sigma-70 family RNA polymerase sigma factor n=1 Tax=Rhizosphaericola mali TaxID=2545455 RepID=A0A5P2G3W6_9BACT|nr:sigma-70 family RNA polymerase sigma factor [Rhizosphaericola mali]QES88522.1 sigma-70 family RNA polymerase sigma factor [Rhizosphaericola mali]
MRAIFEQYYTRLCLFAYNIVSDDQIAEEIVQDAFLKLSDMETKKHVVYFRQWLYSTVKNAAINHLKQKKRRDRQSQTYNYYMYTIHMEKQSNIEDLIIRSEVNRRLWQGVEKLPSQMQQVILMHFEDGKSVGEIARELQLHVSTVKTQKQRGISQLRKYFLFPWVVFAFVCVYDFFIF